MGSSGLLRAERGPKENQKENCCLGSFLAAQAIRSSCEVLSVQYYRGKARGVQGIIHRPGSLVCRKSMLPWVDRVSLTYCIALHLQERREKDSYSTAYRNTSRIFSAFFVGCLCAFGLSCQCIPSGKVISCIRTRRV